ncbi:hypothetical protein [Pelotomaculum propionicicum]|uniref:Uncharacterized protein n=1 Tax=Pelotomaculum propionicicum TaxID=258475 RepID=A0A4Y7RLD9_9FIRM|nr:hypothetical protein [Pelotomaculum propionicicum]NLI11411.1 hypothetical protein [Peptococcaceae bacterium]TEB09673.1 hypothetical protein Pmgp_02919 [Pelotomaculum propionicicum]
MKEIKKLFEESESEITKLIIDKAEQGGYTRYTSANIKDWLLSVREITKGIVKLCLRNETDTLYVDSNYESDEITAFGIKEARYHRSRGVPLSMYLGMAKNYRKAFLAEIGNSHLEPARKESVLKKINLYFDQFEIGCCMEWEKSTTDQKLYELQEVNRLLGNEISRLRHTNGEVLDFFNNFSNEMCTKVKEILDLMENLFNQDLDEEQREKIKAVYLKSKQLHTLLGDIQQKARSAVAGS